MAAQVALRRFVKSEYFESCFFALVTKFRLISRHNAASDDKSEKKTFEEIYAKYSLESTGSNLENHISYFSNRAKKHQQDNTISTTSLNANSKQNLVYNDCKKFNDERISKIVISSAKLHSMNFSLILIFHTSIDLHNSLLAKPIYLHGRLNNDHFPDEYIDRMRKRKCFAEKDLEEITSENRRDHHKDMAYQMVLFKKDTDNNGTKRKIEHRLSPRVSSETNSFEETNLILNSNSLIQYYFLVYSYLMNSQQQCLLNNSQAVSIRYEADSATDIDNLIPIKNADLCTMSNGSPNDFNSKKAKANKFSSKVTNFSVDALLNAT